MDDSAHGGAQFADNEEGLTTKECEALLAQYGRNELEEKKKSKLVVFLKLLISPMAIALWIAILIEAVLLDYVDVALLLAIQFANAGIAWYESVKAADAVAALKAGLKPRATVRRDGVWQTIDAALLVPGDLCKLAVGAAVPADVRVNVEGGVISVDASALTGESLPVTISGTSDKRAACMGSTVVRGEAEATVTATGSNTFFGRTAMLLNAGSGDDGGSLRRVILATTLALTIGSVVLCLGVLAYLIAYDKQAVRPALSFVVVLLVSAIPITIEIVSTTTLAMGAKQLSKHGAIVTRLSAIEEAAGMNILCSDKTGTLTLNKMVIQEHCPTWVEGETMQSTMRLAALAAKWREPPADALDTMVLGAADLDAIDAEGWKTVDFEPFDASVKRTSAVVHAPGIGYVRVAKGALHAVMALAEPGAASTRVEVEADAAVHELAGRGVRCMAVGSSGPPLPSKEAAQAAAVRLVGLLTFLDPPRPDTHETVEKAMAMGVDVKMITGDNAIIARETMRSLGLGTDIVPASDVKWPKLGPGGELPKDLGVTLAPRAVRADGFAQVFPEHKYAIVEALRQGGFAVGMTGDGVNDAPALKRAHVGVAVAGATDAARAAADIVLTQPGLSAITVALREARIVFRRISNFILYRIAATLYLVVFFFVAVFAIKPSSYDPSYPAYFSLPVLMLLLITALNDGTFVTIGKDTVTPSPRPDRWNLRALFVVAAVLAIPPTLGSLLLLHWALESPHPASLFAKLGLPALPLAKVSSMMFLVVGTMSFLTLFAAREQSWCWASAPHPVLSIASAVSLLVTVMLASFWPAPSPGLLRQLLSDVPVLGLARALPPGGVPGAPADAALGPRSASYSLWPLWTLLYCIFWFLVQDALKVAAWKLLLAVDAFGLRTGSMIPVRATNEFGDDAVPMALGAAGTVEGRLLELRVRDTAAAVEGALAKTSADGTDTLSPAERAKLDSALRALQTASSAVTQTVHEREPIFARTAAAAALPQADDGGAPRLARSSLTAPQRRASFELASATASAQAATGAGLPSAQADPAQRLRRMSVAATEAATAVTALAGAGGMDDAQRRMMRSSLAGIADAQRALDQVEAAVREQGYRRRGRRGGSGCGGCGGTPAADIEAP